MRYILFLVLLVTASVSEAVAAEIVIVQSSRTLAYEEAYEGFLGSGVMHASNGGMKSIQPDLIARIILDHDSTLQSTLAYVEQHDPDLVVAIGSRALSFLRNYTASPLIYLLAPDAGRFIDGKKNMAGIAMKIPAARQLEDFLKVIPGIKKIGLIFNPKYSADFVKEAKLYADALGVTLNTAEIADSREVPAAMHAIGENIDAFWLIADPTVVTSKTVEYILLSTMEQRIPVLAFAEKYLELGATVSVTLDLADMGKQAGEMAKEILMAGEIAPTLRQKEPARNVKIRLNNDVAEKIGIRSNTAAVKQKPQETGSGK